MTFVEEPMSIESLMSARLPYALTLRVGQGLGPGPPRIQGFKGDSMVFGYIAYAGFTSALKSREITIY
jgi:hypothetical protein